MNENFDNFENQDSQIIETTEETNKTENKKKTFLGVGGIFGTILEWVVLIAIAAAVALFLRAHVFTIVHVSGPSMESTLQDRDWLYVNRFMYTPERSHIIIFTPNQDPDRVYIKRVIAVAGDTIYIAGDGNVYLNGEVIDEPYIKNQTNIGSFIRDGGFTRDNPLTIEEGYIFVMGDNRQQSQDSRSLGPVPVGEVMGRAMFRLFGRLH